MNHKIESMNREAKEIVGTSGVSVLRIQDVSVLEERTGMCCAVPSPNQNKSIAELLK